MDNLIGVNKPVTLKKDEYIQILTEATNNSGLPMFIIEYILRDLLSEVSKIAKQEAEFEKSQYEEAVAKQQAIESDIIE